jgi:hypothetical protein
VGGSEAIKHLANIDPARGTVIVTEKFLHTQRPNASL